MQPALGTNLSGEFEDVVVGIVVAYRWVPELIERQRSLPGDSNVLDDLDLPHRSAALGDLDLRRSLNADERDTRRVVRQRGFGTNRIDELDLPGGSVPARESGDPHSLLVRDVVGDGRVAADGIVGQADPPVRVSGVDDLDVPGRSVEAGNLQYAGVGVMVDVGDGGVAVQAVGQGVEWYVYPGTDHLDVPLLGEVIEAGELLW